MCLLEIPGASEEESLGDAQGMAFLTGGGAEQACVRWGRGVVCLGRGAQGGEVGAET